jgi:CBS domain-containing protein
MKVQDLLAAKRGDVVCIEPNAQLATAAAVLAQKKIGALVVVGAERRVIGIVSERDIVRALAEHGGEALTRQIGQTMTRDVVTCSVNESIDQVMSLMTAGKFRHLPVVENDSLIGIVSIGDVVKNRLQEIENESQALREYIRTA